MAIGHRSSELSRRKGDGMNKRVFHFSSSFVSLPMLMLSRVGCFAVTCLGVISDQMPFPLRGRRVFVYGMYSSRSTGSSSPH